jgi:phosphatidylserine decarboxylase
MSSSRLVYYIDRKTNTKKREVIYGDTFLSILYANNPLSKWLSYIISHLNWVSKLYGFLQTLPYSKKKIMPFIKKYSIDSSEFAQTPESFASFNEFFCRKLKKDARPQVLSPEVVTAPADGRYLVIPNISKSHGFYIKGKKFCLESLLQEHALSDEYAEGAMAIIRLCPTDYHRFHFPVSGRPSAAKLINGPLWSVNPLATIKNCAILSENKRMITYLHNELFGQIIYIEVGATNVGSIHQTYQPHTFISKGEEKGFFAFGGSCIILLFKPHCLEFDQDLVSNSAQYLETLVLTGDSLGKLQKKSANNTYS